MNHLFNAKVSLSDFDIDPNVEPLGTGNYCSVVVATHKGSNLKVAIKIIENSVVEKLSLRNPKIKLEIMNEKNNGILLRGNKMVPQMLTTFMTHSRKYFVYELIEGGELWNRLGHKLDIKPISSPNTAYIHSFPNFLPENTVRLVTKQLIRALKWFHDRGIAHRDLKPENIFLRKPCSDSCLLTTLRVYDLNIIDPPEKQCACSADGIIKDEDVELVVGDFGSSKDLLANNVAHYESIRQLNGSKFAISSFDFVGTPEYMSPETIHPPVLQEGQFQSTTPNFSSPSKLTSTEREDIASSSSTKRLETDPRTDLWSLGSCVYHMLVGVPPFRAASSYLTMEHTLLHQKELKSGADAGLSVGHPTATCPGLLFPPFVSAAAADFVRSLLQRDRRSRLGVVSADSVRQIRLENGGNLPWYVSRMGSARQKVDDGDVGSNDDTDPEAVWVDFSVLMKHPFIAGTGAETETEKSDAGRCGWNVPVVRAADPLLFVPPVPSSRILELNRRVNQHFESILSAFHASSESTASSSPVSGSIQTSVPDASASSLDDLGKWLATPLQEIGRIIGPFSDMELCWARAYAAVQALSGSSRQRLLHSFQLARRLSLPHVLSLFPRHSAVARVCRVVQQVSLGVPGRLGSLGPWEHVSWLVNGHAISRCDRLDTSTSICDGPDQETSSDDFTQISATDEKESIPLVEVDGREVAGDHCLVILADVKLDLVPFLEQIKDSTTQDEEDAISTASERWKALDCVLEKVGQLEPPPAALILTGQLFFDSDLESDSSKAAKAQAVRLLGSLACRRLQDRTAVVIFSNEPETQFDTNGQLSVPLAGAPRVTPTAAFVSGTRIVGCPSLDAVQAPAASGSENSTVYWKKMAREVSRELSLSGRSSVHSLALLATSNVENAHSATARLAAAVGGDSSNLRYVVYHCKDAVNAFFPLVAAEGFSETRSLEPVTPSHGEWVFLRRARVTKVPPAPVDSSKRRSRAKVGTKKKDRIEVSPCSNDEDSRSVSSSIDSDADYEDEGDDSKTSNDLVLEKPNLTNALKLFAVPVFDNLFFRHNTLEPKHLLIPIIKVSSSRLEPGFVSANSENPSSILLQFG